LRRLRVAVLTHEDLVPPESIEGMSEKEIQPFKREYGVVRALLELGHEVIVLGVSDDLIPIRRVVEEWHPHIVFNLLMEFQDVGAYQVHVASYLELLNVPYTGCNPAGILLTRDKPLAKKILRYHRIPTPAFTVFPRGQKVHLSRSMRFPLFVKPVEEEASYGIAQASIVNDVERAQERVAFVHDSVGMDAIAEEYIDGRELTISVLGNRRLVTFPVWEMFFQNLSPGAAPIATARVKWDLEYQRRLGIKVGPAEALCEETARRIARLAKRVFRILNLSGYARLDLRLAADGRVFVIEVNATPDITYDEDFAESAKAVGLSYPQLLQRILNRGLSYQAPWMRI
jgi:D-alanine-D-alanine ligase